jgi:hypothetical protein
MWICRGASAAQTGSAESLTRVRVLKAPSVTTSSGLETTGSQASEARLTRKRRSAPGRDRRQSLSTHQWQ